MKVKNFIITPRAKKIINNAENKNHDIGNSIECVLENLKTKIPETSCVKVTPRHIFNFFFRNQESIHLDLFKGKKKKTSLNISFPKKFPPQYDEAKINRPRPNIIPKDCPIFLTPLFYTKAYENLYEKTVKAVQTFHYAITYVYK